MTLQITNYNVHRVLVDIGSSVDMLFRFAYNQMGLPPIVIKLVDTLLYGFSSHCVQPHGVVELPVTDWPEQ